MDGVFETMNSCLFLIQVDKQQYFLVVYTILNVLRYPIVVFVRQKELNNVLLFNE